MKVAALIGTLSEKGVECMGHSVPIPWGPYVVDLIGAWDYDVGQITAAIARCKATEEHSSSEHPSGNAGVTGLISPKRLPNQGLSLPMHLRSTFLPLTVLPIAYTL